MTEFIKLQDFGTTYDKLNALLFVIFYIFSFIIIND